MFSTALNTSNNNSSTASSSNPYSFGSNTGMFRFGANNNNTSNTGGQSSMTSFSKTRRTQPFAMAFPPLTTFRLPSGQFICTAFFTTSPQLLD